MSDIELDGTGAMRQAGMTADDYLSKAYEILKSEYEDWTVRDAIELAKIMAQDFHTAMMCVKMQEIRDSINEISSTLNSDKL
jgi:hypothetical protein